MSYFAIVDKILNGIHTGLQFFRDFLVKAAEFMHIQPDLMVDVVLIVLATLLSYQFMKKIVTRPIEYSMYLIALIFLIYTILYKL